MVRKIGMLAVAGMMLLGISHDAAGQFGFAAFGKAKKNRTPVLDPKGPPPPKGSLFDFGGPDSLLTFDGPISAVKRFNENTQHALAEARGAMAKPFTELKDARLWPARDPNSGNSGGSFQIIPDWMKLGSQAQPRQPATLGDWLSQERPQ